MLKGASSVLYGQGETGATINILTKQPLPDWYAAASVTAGSYGFVSPSIDVSGPLTCSKALRFRLNAAYQQEDSFVDFVDSDPARPSDPGRAGSQAPRHDGGRPSAAAVRASAASSVWLATLRMVSPKRTASIHGIERVRCATSFVARTARGAL